MTYIHFIINPISGSGKHNLTPELIQEHFPADLYTVKTDYTTRKKHAVELTAAAVQNNPDYIVACGGDGTINEVASCLIGTSIILGILPVGSGNGLASNLNIPRDFKKAIDIIKKGQTTLIDAGKINESYFFSNTGIGIDAMIIKKYENSGRRTLVSYIKSALISSFEFKSESSIISFEEQTISTNPFMVFISNSNEMGYNMSLTPKASLHDGLLDLVIIPELSFVEKLVLGYYVLRNSVQKFKKAKHFLVTDIHIEIPSKIFTDAQIDGEHYKLKSNKIDVSILPHSLKVVV